MELRVNRTYLTNDQHLYFVDRKAEGNYMVGHRVGSKSQRLFYPDGQQVAHGNHGDIIAAE